ncbi:MAG: hypothetical protein EA378_10595 [Phycisphaerales bacterium]|nr:MAG: hypothetical protein EA378_10595 [Phycisphaerales bacterium]
MSKAADGITDRTQADGRASARARQRRRVAGVSLATALLAGGACLVGCGSTSGPRPEASPGAFEPAERTRRAVELAEQARHAERRGKIDEASRLYAESLSLDPNLFVSLNNLGVLLMHQQNYLDAVQYLTRAADVEPRDPRPVTNIALCWQRSGHDRDALRYFNQALARDRNWLDAIRGYALSSQRLRLVNREALNHVKRGTLIETDPTWREFFQRERIRLETALPLQDEQG